MKLYERMMGIKGTNRTDDWPFPMVTGDEIRGNRNFKKLRLLLFTAGTAEDRRSLSALQPLITSALNDEAHENNSISMIRASTHQCGVDMTPFIKNGTCMYADGTIINEVPLGFELAMIPSTGSMSATTNAYRKLW